jgi:hypothetical protein
MITPLPMLRQHHTTRHWPHRPSSSSSFSSKATTTADFALFSTPSNSIDAEIINYKRTLLFPSSSSSRTTKNRYRNSHRRRNSGSPLRSSTSSNNNNGNGSSSAAADTSATATSTPSSEEGGTAAVSFLQAIDKFGMNLKPLAIAAYEQSTKTSSSSVNGSTTSSTNNNNTSNSNSNTSIKTIVLRLKSNILWTLYILYRGYRGFFVILPAVFREVYRQLESSDLVIDAYNDDDDDDDVSISGVVGVGGSNEVEESKPLRWRTRITISILSSILTLSYVVSGALRVLGKLFVVVV